MAEKTSKIKLNIQMLKKLPTLSHTAEKIINLVAKESTHLDELVNILENDPPILSKVIGTANIVYFGFYQPVISLKDAILKIGFKTLKNIALSIALFSIFNPSGQKEISYRRLYRHSIAVGAICQIIHEKFLKSSTYNSFTTGVLHDIGLFVLHHAFYDLFRNIENELSKGVSLQEAEKKITGISHTEIGKWLAEAWGLPELIGDVIFHHHEQPEKLKNNKEIIALVQLSDFIAKKLGYSTFNIEKEPELYKEVYEILPVPPVDYLISEMKETISKVEQL